MNIFIFRPGKLDDTVTRRKIDFETYPTARMIYYLYVTHTRSIGKSTKNLIPGYVPSLRYRVLRILIVITRSIHSNPSVQKRALDFKGGGDATSKPLEKRRRETRGLMSRNVLPSRVKRKTRLRKVFFIRIRYTFQHSLSNSLKDTISSSPLLLTGTH